MKLKALTIGKLWGKKTFSIKLNGDVNIFSGINGSGKTTILEIIYSILEGEIQDEEISNKYESAQFQFTDDYQIDIVTIEGSKNVTYRKGDVLLSSDEFQRLFSYACVSSFDYAPYTSDERMKLKEQYPWVQSELDFGLARSLQNYYMYVVSITNQIRRAAEQNATKSKPLLQYFHSLFEMQDKCDELFAPSLEWDRESDIVQFKLKKYDDERITPHELSAGEKQMLILLINTLCQRKQECIVLWDEPELSMHVDWQKVLIKTMMEINPKMQLILTTHSPFVIYDGWENRVVNIQNIIK